MLSVLITSLVVLFHFGLLPNFYGLVSACSEFLAFLIVSLSPGEIHSHLKLLPPPTVSRALGKDWLKPSDPNGITPQTAY